MRRDDDKTTWDGNINASMISRNTQTSMYSESEFGDDLSSRDYFGDDSVINYI